MAHGIKRLHLSPKRPGCVRRRNTKQSFVQWLHQGLLNSDMQSVKISALIYKNDNVFHRPDRDLDLDSAHHESRPLFLLLFSPVRLKEECLRLPSVNINPDYIEGEQMTNVGFVFNSPWMDGIRDTCILGLILTTTTILSVNMEANL